MGKKSETSNGDSKKAPKKALKVRKSVKSEAAAEPKKKAKTALREVKPVSVRETNNAVKPPTFEEIQLQAYFIAQKRVKLGLPGNSDTDWIQAEKELLAARVA